jgi:N-acetylmuramoyl-L-alanine amidase
VSKQHVVVQGECLSQIAKRYGFQSHLHLWNHPDNAELRERRRNPNILHPGDVVAIPDKEQRSESCATGKTHRFEAKRLAKELRVVFERPNGDALADVAYEIEVAGESRSGQTDAKGLLKERVPPDSKECTIRIEGRTLHCRLGYLNPLAAAEAGDVSGVQARLRNLGFAPGPIDGRIGPKTRSAIAIFQAEMDLSVDGEPASETLERLEQEHGC